MKSFEPPRPPHQKRYGWFRLYDDFWDHPKWELVAQMTGTRVELVTCIAGRLMRAASRHKPRGWATEFSAFEAAAKYRVDPSVIKAIYEALEDLAWIDGGYLTTWDERQPDKEDPTNAERQRHFRERKRAELGKLDAPARNALHNAQTQTHISKEASVTALKPGDSVDWGGAQEWLKEHRTGQRQLPFKTVVGQRGPR